MISLAPDAGFENENGGTLSGLAEIVTTPVNTGAKALKLRTRNGFGGDQGSAYTTNSFPVVFGSTYPVDFAANSDSAESGTGVGILVEVDYDESGAWDSLGTLSPTLNGWEWVTGIFSFVAAGSTARLRFTSLSNAAPLGTWIWYVDDILVMGDSLAIKLAERAIDAWVTQLQADLGTELGLIDTDRADGITLAVPTNADYYKREKPEISGGTAHVEVFESDFVFDNPYTDSDAQRAVYRIPITIRLTCFSRDGDTADTMEKRKRRYAVGLFNVGNKTPGLSEADANAAVLAAATGVNAAVVRQAEDNKLKVQVELATLVTCEET